MENILPFFAISFLYVFVFPWPKVAVWLFRISGGARILHTLYYAFYPLPQLPRSILFFVVWLITLWMAFWVLLVFCG